MCSYGFRSHLGIQTARVSDTALHLAAIRNNIHGTYIMYHHTIMHSACTYVRMYVHMIHVKLRPVHVHVVLKYQALYI